ncbi:MAG: hypothetical protein LBT59_23605 [Clostridiales bacterium]|jgi:hypothetical protein|nr:hypothetical protein [Clostridiales bacterium]
MRQESLIKLSAISGLLSGITWAIGDILIVGFKTNLAAYPGIANSDMIKDKELAATMIQGGTGRLMAGALVAAFTIPLMILALYSVKKLLTGAAPIFVNVLIAILFVAFSWSPLAHAAFFYVGEASKLAVELDAAPAYAMTQVFIDMLYANWYAAIIATGIGWLLASIAIFGGRTALPRYFGLLTPLPVTAFLDVVYIVAPFLIPDFLAGAVFNLAAIVFYASVAVFCFRHPRRLANIK